MCCYFTTFTRASQSDGSSSWSRIYRVRVILQEQWRDGGWKSYEVQNPHLLRLNTVLWYIRQKRTFPCDPTSPFGPTKEVCVCIHRRTHTAQEEKEIKVQSMRGIICVCLK